MMDDCPTNIHDPYTDVKLQCALWLHTCPSSTSGCLSMVMRSCLFEIATHGVCPELHNLLVVHVEQPDGGHQDIPHLGDRKAFPHDVRTLLLRVDVLNADMSVFLYSTMQPRQIELARSRDMPHRRCPPFQHMFRRRPIVFAYREFHLGLVVPLSSSFLHESPSARLPPWESPPAQRMPAPRQGEANGKPEPKKSSAGRPSIRRQHSTAMIAASVEL